jgi:hypothetical protein
MNWARDNEGISDVDFSKVFKYEPRESTVIRMLSDNNWQPEICSLEREKQWYHWVEEGVPAIQSDVSGLVLLLLKRNGEPSLRGIEKASSNDWISKAKKERPLEVGLQRSNTFAGLEEKHVPQVAESGTKPKISSSRRSVRTVPFSRETFEHITRKLHTHGSIARVISRADVPVFTGEKVNMTEPAFVYNCRSSNAWELDLALTVTHFPKNRLTMAILFGCTFAMEEEIITRLSHLKAEAAHPFLIPGIFAELEAVRHRRLVEEMGNEVEAKVFDLDFQSNNLHGPEGAKSEKRGREKRTAYLDLAYLRNGLVSWNRQLAEMIRHAHQLTHNEYRYGQLEVLPQSLPDEWVEVDAHPQSLRRRETIERLAYSNYSMKVPNDTYFEQLGEARPCGIDNILHTTSLKIKQRLISLRDDYDDRIQDCTMRVEGMAMSTQWAHAETNVEIALSTNRDSRHMRSIALVTMIFLPGTFFATMFSMTFFNWPQGSGAPAVSAFIWIYFLVTAVFTILTLVIWYYIVIYRPSRKMKAGQEESQ